MTFKHTKFEDSVTMRSLEKVAKDKGWVKQEDLIKSASPQIDLTPSGVLSIDILKLCSGLRHNGFDKYADEIEAKFVNYKLAATSLYDSTGETGEDLIDFAHPKGSHKMEDVAGDATFHTIVDKHLKMLNVVNKEPKGKLAANKDILNAVRIALGAPPLGYGEVNLPTGANIFGKTPAIELAGGGEAAATGGSAAAGTGVGLAAGVTAVAASAIIGGVIGYKIFENKFYATNLQKAGENLLSEISDIETEESWQGQTDKVTAFKLDLSRVITLAEQAAAAITAPSASALEAIGAYYDSLSDASWQASKIMAAAREMYSIGIFSGFRDVEIAASNFINVANRALSEVRTTINKIKDLKRQEQTTTKSNVGGDLGAQLESDYSSVLSDVSRLKSIVQTKNAEPQKTQAIIKWLDNVSANVTKRKANFDAETNKEAVAKILMDKFDAEVKARLNAFKNEATKRGWI